MDQADPRSVMCGAADGVDEWLPPRATQKPRVEGGQAPILSVPKEFVGRRADPHPGCEEAPPPPRVESVRCEADRDIGNDPDLPRRAGELAVEVELQPLVKRDAIRSGADIAWPVPPGLAVLFAKRVEGREIPERSALLARPVRETCRVWGGAKDSLERFGLQAEDLVVVDSALAVER